MKILRLKDASSWDGYEDLADSVLTPENRFRAAALNGRNCFLTGAGGTGKSTLLREFIDECPARWTSRRPPAWRR